MKVLAGGAVITALWLVNGAFGGEQGYMSQPALNGNSLVFVSEGDLWSATLPETLSGEVILAHRLTSGAGEETRPTISPDGTQVAFSAEYDGNTDVYVMPIDGGMPKRLTEDPGDDIALTWTADGGSILFSSPRRNPMGHSELWSISTAGGMPTRFGFGECSMVGLSATGRRFAFTRWSNENWSWNRYRGGTAPDIWVGEMGTESYKNLTDNPASDLFPMWIGGRVYFASDRDGAMNIWSDKADGGDPKQHTHFKDGAGTDVDGYALKWPSVDSGRGGRRIVFCQGGQLSILDTGKDAVTRLNVQLVSDRAFARKRFVPLMETVSEFALMKGGEELVVGSRGDFATVDVDTGAVTELTQSSASREWGGALVGDDRLVMITDAGGEQQIAWMKLDGSTGTPQILTQQKNGWMYPPATSPDGR
ncbi:MAG TPA: hypothetical protein VG711_05965, partial [Phycisphaerales bacterium]|nr:hypothetical protein [Phycisphaerales bacterium]